MCDARNFAGKPCLTKCYLRDVGKKKSKAKSEKHSGKGCMPKKECCLSKSRCGRCPIRMLKEGTMPSGYTVHKRKLVKVDKKAA